MASDAFAGAAPRALVCLGAGNNEVAASGCDLKSYNKEDLVEVALATGVRNSVLAHVASSTGAAYAGPWQHFEEWCSSLARPRCPLPADDFTVVLYLQSVVEMSQSFDPVKSASATIAFF